MGMDIDKTWGHEQPLSIDFFGGGAGDCTDLLNDAIDDFDVANVGLGARTVSDQAVTND